VIFILVAGWVIDLLLSRGFSILVAPAYANLNRALAYASGRLTLNVILTIVLALDLTSCLTLMGPGTTTFLVFLLLSLSAFVVQVVWFSKVYRCTLPNAVSFYLILLVLHTVVLGLLTPLFFSGEIDRGVKAYVNECLEPRLQREADAARQAAAGSVGPRDTARRQVADLEARISAARAGQVTLQKAIEDQKNSAAFAFSGLVKLRAQGDLAGARAKFEVFLRRFPNDPLAQSARGQIGEIDRALAAQAEMKRQQEADAARMAAQARANLLARAAAGQATLSEMRLALIGKTPPEVHSLFGAPSETASDRWGYAQKMIFDPITNTHRGLSVIFSDGLVQGVDYYYGSEP